MIPFILAAVGGYLIGDSMKDSEIFADGGMANGGAVSKNYVVIHFKDKKSIKKRGYDSSYKAFSDYENEGVDYVELFNEKGHLMSSYPKKMADGGQFDYGYGFTVRGMNETLRSKFPDSFGFSVYPLDNNYTVGTLKRGETESYKGLSDADIKSKLYFPQYKRDHEINYHITQGGENTYFDFLLEDENGKGYVGTFGFKDQGDVPASYITEFIAFLQEAYGLPFTIEHTVK